MDNEIRKKLLEELMAKMGGDSLKRSSKMPALTIAIGMGKPGMDHGDEETAADIAREKGFSHGEMETGEDVEMEHTDDPMEAEKIAMDHLKEKPDYYSKLKEAGLSDGEEEEDENEPDDMEDLDPRLMKLLKEKLMRRK